MLNLSKLLTKNKKIKTETDPHRIKYNFLRERVEDKQMRPFLNIFNLITNNLKHNPNEVFSYWSKNDSRVIPSFDNPALIKNLYSRINLITKRYNKKKEFPTREDIENISNYLLILGVKYDEGTKDFLHNKEIMFNSKAYYPKSLTMASIYSQFRIISEVYGFDSSDIFNK